MKKSFEFVSAKGMTVRFEGEYNCRLVMRYADPDHNVEMGLEESTAGSMMTVFVNGKKYDSCWNPSSWRLIDTETGSRKVWGLKIAFADPAIAEQYEAFIAELMEEGTTEEVKARRAEQAKVKAQQEITDAEAIVKSVSSPDALPTLDAAKEQARRYNDIVNEGGEGFVPHILSREEYDSAVKTLEALNPTGYSVSINHWTDGSGFTHSEIFETGVPFQSAREYISGCLGNGIDFAPMDESESLQFAVVNSEGESLSSCWLSDVEAPNDTQ